jgi:hypothetical protein
MGRLARVGHYDSMDRCGTAGVELERPANCRRQPDRRCPVFFYNIATEQNYRLLSDLIGPDMSVPAGNDTGGGIS